MSQIIDPFIYIAKLVGAEWEINAGCFYEEKCYYLIAQGHGQRLFGKGNDLIHAFIDMKEKIEAWKHEQEELDYKDEQDTRESLLVGMHP